MPVLGEMWFPTHVVFGAGTLRELPAQLRAVGARAPLVVTDPGVVKAGLYAKLQAALAEAGLPHALFAEVHPNPVEEDCLAGLEAFRRGEADSVVALGGGSAMDAGKIVRLLVAHEPPLAQYDDLQGGSARIAEPMPPMIAIPTTAGTGSEVGRSAVVTLTEGHRKAVIFAPALIPTVALCDPELTLGLPPGPTAATGMDAFVHCLEAYCATGFHPLADAVALDGLGRAARALPRAFANGADAQARSEMMVAAIMGATAFQKGLGACHSLAHALTPVCGVHHGLANAVMIRHVVEFNRPAIEDRLARVALAMGEFPGGGTADLAKAAVTRVEQLCRAIAIPVSLKEVGLREDQIPEVVERAMADGCHQLNPRRVTAEDFERLVRAAF
ncbi:MAG TPA: iron-containing alcohol dehydrogenase [Myxococcales bacterium]|nr:iron-containing alcohol dehydrogenase [Myxococcales bacterium]